MEVEKKTKNLGGGLHAPSYIRGQEKEEKDKKPCTHLSTRRRKKKKKKGIKFRPAR